jgi:hypothetical protein
LVGKRGGGECPEMLQVERGTPLLQRRAMLLGHPTQGLQSKKINSDNKTTPDKTPQIAAEARGCQGLFVTVARLLRDCCGLLLTVAGLLQAVANCFDTVAECFGTVADCFGTVSDCSELFRDCCGLLWTVVNCCGTVADCCGPRHISIRAHFVWKSAKCFFVRYRGYTPPSPCKSCWFQQPDTTRAAKTHIAGQRAPIGSCCPTFRVVLSWARFNPLGKQSPRPRPAASEEKSPSNKHQQLPITSLLVAHGRSLRLY